MQFRLLVTLISLSAFVPTGVFASEFSWAVAIRPSGWGHALGTGATVEEAQEDAIARCRKTSAGTGGYLVAKCRIVASFSGREKGCVSIINGGERHGAGSSRNFYKVIRGQDREARSEVRLQCRGGKFGSRGYTYDCRGYKAYCSRDAYNRFYYNRE
jgi:hypothetical protein